MDNTPSHGSAEQTNNPLAPASGPPISEKSAVEKEYEHMISFHKWIVKAVPLSLGIIVVAAQVVFYRDMSQVRQQVGTEITEARDAARREITKVREDAGKIAIDEAQKRVEEAFRSQNIQEMIETAAKRQLGPAIDRRVRQEIDLFTTGLQAQISSLGEIADLATRMRIGLRSGLEGLSLKARTAANESDRAMAQAFLSRVSADYETFHREGLRKQGVTPRQAMFRLIPLLRKIL
jgi:hypothetical protein